MSKMICRIVANMHTGEVLQEIRFVEAYDPEAHDGRGALQTTADRKRALKLPRMEWFQLWKAVPKCRPRRKDGKPNRPLTAYTILFEPAPGEET